MHFAYFLEDDRDECDYVLFIHASTLLEEVDARSNAEQLTVPWENWGPLKTRIMPICNYRADCHVYGMRMLDFNPLALRCLLDTSLLSWQDELIVRGRRRDGEVMIDRESIVHLGQDSVSQWETARLELLCI
ncbi:hypothetical protein JB92DRAFT_2832884 [Gautieria morchelliformis]|nr:hypothetical protein JB92DRAFT_2832884 [Gautieria morchelliformis]